MRQLWIRVGVLGRDRSGTGRAPPRGRQRGGPESGGASRGLAPGGGAV